MIKVGIVGAAGYTGGELIRLLIHHPRVDLVFAQSTSNAGKPVYSVHGDLLGETAMVFSASHHFNIDLLFLCQGHGLAKKFLEANECPDYVRVIDLGNDFRLQKDSIIGNRKFIYGLPELNRQSIIEAKNIANPGCFATALQLGLLPLAAKGLVGKVYATGITGSTGAGQSLSATSHFSWRQNNIQAYKTLSHQHIGEITESVNQLQQAAPIQFKPEDNAIRFVPWRGDFTRGIFISSMLESSLSIEDAYYLYDQYYHEAKFTHLSKDAIALKQVVNTNKCMIQLEKAGDTLVVHSIIDNLLKGASGQAVQNMNLMYGFDEDAGLQLKASFF